MGRADRVKETTTTTGTGTLTTSGTAATGYQAFATAFATGDVVDYCIAGQGTAEWEVGQGTFTSSTTLSRDVVLASSNAGARVSFSAGTKDVFNVMPAARMMSGGEAFALARGMTMS